MAESATFQRIVTATDLAPGSKRALRRSVTLARTLGAELHLIHVAPCPPVRRMFFTTPGPARCEGDAPLLLTKARKKLDDYLRGESLDGVAFTSVLRSGRPADEVLCYVAEFGADLVIVGEHPESKIHHLWEHLAFEGVGKQIRRTATCAVLTVR